MARHFIKLITHKYTPVQIQVRNATSNDAWGPSSSELREIALLTYHEVYGLEVYHVLAKRLADKPKNWRHIMKALTVILFCIYEGSDSALEWIKANRFLIDSLRHFRYADDRNIDQGASIRTKAATLVDMIESPEKMELEKQKYNKIRAQMGRPGIVDMNGGDTPKDFRKSSHRMTMDLQGRLSTGATTGSTSSTAPSSSSNPSNVNGNGVTSPRASSEFVRKPYTRPSLSLDGRYSLSLPLQSIKE